MTYWLVRARPRWDRLPELRARLDAGEVVRMRPFGEALDLGLRQARRDPDGWATWEEEDYCVPPLAQERAAVLDTYFDDLQVEAVPRGEGWRRIAGLPSLWTASLRRPPT